MILYISALVERHWCLVLTFYNAHERKIGETGMRLPTTSSIENMGMAWRRDWEVGLTQLRVSWSMIDRPLLGANSLEPIESNDAVGELSLALL